MTLEILEQERDLARKNGQKARLVVLNDIIAKVRAKEVAGKKKVALTEQMVNDTLIEYRKMLKDGIKQIPEGHTVRAEYEGQLEVLSEFCPPVLDNREQIENLITETLTSRGVPIEKKGRGLMMKTLMPVLRANYVDMETAVSIIDSMLEN